MKSRIASALCVVPALYCGGSLFFALWNYQDYATALPQLVRYVVVPGLLFALFMWVALFGSRVNRVMLGGTGIALLAGMFAFEARLEARYAAALVGLTDVPSHRQMVAAGVDRGLPPAHTVKKLNRRLAVRRLEDAVLSGVPNERVLLCSRGGVPLIYKADRYGFRNPDAAYDVPVERMLVGDSFVEGICLSDTKDLVGQVRELGPNAVGIGTRGAGPMMELAMLGRFGAAIRPRWTVIVFYEGNDWENLAHEVAYPWLQDTLSDAPRFGPATMPAAMRIGVDQVLGIWAANPQPRHTWATGRTNVVRNTLALHQTWAQLGLAYPKAARSMPVYGRILAQARKVAAGWGGRVALLYVPQTSRLVGAVPHGFVFDEIRDQVIEATARNGIPMVDLSPTFAADPETMTLYGNDGHLSERGARIAAALLGRTLDEQGGRE